MFDTPAKTEPVSLPELKQKFIEAKRVTESFDEPMQAANDILRERLAKVQTEWEQENSELIKTYLEANAVYGEAEVGLRDGCIAEYERTGEKTFDDDLSVRVNTRLDYDPAKATEWAKENATFILVADAKQFKNLDIARKLDFVEEIKTVSAVISTKL